MSKRILIVDDEPWVRQMVRTMLERRGHTVHCCESAEQALETAPAFTPHLLITDVLMGGMDGWTLVRMLRSQPSLNMMAVIFLTALNSEEDRILGFRLGADDYLAKPFRFEELDLRVERVLRTLERLRSHVQTELVQVQNEGVGLRGELEQLGASSLLTILEMERKSGVLVVRGPTIGRIFLRDGQVVAAGVGHNETVGADAVYQILTWTQGSFEFSALVVDMSDSINTSTTHLLMEAARRIDEAQND